MKVIVLLLVASAPPRSFQTDKMPHQTNQLLTDGCFFGVYIEELRSISSSWQSPGWPMLLKNHHSWPLAVSEKMCFVEDHGILKGAGFDRYV